MSSSLCRSINQGPDSSGTHTPYPPHVSSLKPSITALAIYVIDLVLHALKTRVVLARIECSGPSTVRITMDRLSGWRAGQHVFLRVPAVGGLTRFEPHPFTIASTEPGMVLLAKAAGGWTGRLRSLVDEGGKGGERVVQVFVDGPYVRVDSLTCC